MQTLVAAVAQMVSGRGLQENLVQAQMLLEQAKSEGAQLVVLPENFAYFGYKPLAEVAEGEGRASPACDFLAAQSRALGLWIIAGTAPFAASASGTAAPEGKVYAGNSIWSPSGEMIARYDKCHLFDATVSDGVGSYRESDTFVGGDGPLSVMTPWGELGLSVCYDLRFPEYYRQLASERMTMLSVPAAFTYRTGKAHWEVLLKARAIENQCFVLAANQGGDHGRQRITYGHSCIISPWGEVLTMLEDPGPGVALAQLNLSEIEALRADMPVLQHRRLLSFNDKS